MKRKLFTFILTAVMLVGICGQAVYAFGESPFQNPGSGRPPIELPTDGSNPAEGHYYSGGYAVEGWPYGQGYFNPYGFLNEGQDGQYLPYYLKYTYTYDNPEGFMLGNYYTDEYSYDPYAYHPMTYLPYVYDLNPNGGYMANGVLYPTYTYNYSYGSYPVYYHQNSDMINTVPYDWDPYYYLMYPYQNTQFDDWGGPGAYANPVPVQHLPHSFNNPFSLFDYWGGWLYKKGEHPLLKGLPNFGVQQNLSPNNPLKYMYAVEAEAARQATEEAKAKKDGENKGEGDKDQPLSKDSVQNANPDVAPTERKRSREEAPPQPEEQPTEYQAPEPSTSAGS